MGHDFARLGNRAISDPTESSDYSRSSAARPQHPVATPEELHIDLGSIQIDALDDTHLQPSADAKPDEMEQAEEDRDALTASKFEAQPKGRGIHIRVPGGKPAGTPEYPDGVRWIQTIVTNAPLFGQTSPYVDYAPPKDDKPFYFSDAGERSMFSDSPSRNKKNDIQWLATLSLVGVKGLNVTRLDSVEYGFSIDPAGKLSLRAPAAAGDLATQASTLRSEYSGWSFGAGFAAMPTPAPTPAPPAAAPIKGG